MNSSLLLDKKFVGTHELRTNLSGLLAAFEDHDSEIIITKQGKPVAVLVDVEAYLELIETIQDLSDPEFVKELNEAVDEVRSGKGIPADKVFKKLGI